ncbi:MAG: DUF2795 domain-containing protein [Deltaproteobacteria bacterium]|nr:DUF2795 domain-containing protein [Deltaproteobacteria bacterium]
MSRTPTRRRQAVATRADDAPLAERLDGALAGAVFPLEPNNLAVVARSNGASHKIIRMLAGLPDRAFGSVGDVRGALPPK